MAESTRLMGNSCGHDEPEYRNFASGSPDETTRTAGKTSWRSPTAPGWRILYPYDDHLAPDGRVMEILSEHQCQGWLEGTS